MKLNELLELIEVDTTIRINIWGGDGVKTPFFHHNIYTGDNYSFGESITKLNKSIMKIMNSSSYGLILGERSSGKKYSMLEYVKYTCGENKIIDVSVNLSNQLVINISDRKDGE